MLIMKSYCRSPAFCYICSPLGFTVCHFSNVLVSRSSEVSKEDDFEAVEDPANLFLAKTIQSMEEKMNSSVVHESVVDEIPDPGDNLGSGNVCVALKTL